MPHGERDDDGGQFQFVSESGDEGFPGAVQAADAGATTSEAAETTGCEYGATEERPDDLEEGGVTARTVGNAPPRNGVDEGGE